MSNNEFFQSILDNYPSFITKDQMYRICHISKKTALYLLQSGLVPSVDSGKKTRKYKIKTVDVVEYLKNRDINFESYSAPVGWYQNKHAKQKEENYSIVSPEVSEKMEDYYNYKLTKYPDVLNTKQIIDFTGYQHSAIGNWCKNSKIHYFLIRNGFKVPKQSLIDFMLSDYFIRIQQKSEKHKNMLRELMTWKPTTNSKSKTRKHRIPLVKEGKDLKNEVVNCEIIASQRIKQNEQEKKTTCIVSQEETEKTEAYYHSKLKIYPDILDAQQINDFLGYKSNVINRWCKDRLIQCFLIRCAYKVPKQSLIEFMLSDNFKEIEQKSIKHRKMLLEFSSWIPEDE